MFRVVADQLKISDGWVRCGHCADVFDATLYLEAWLPPTRSDEDGPGEGAAALPAAGEPPLDIREEEFLPSQEDPTAEAAVAQALPDADPAPQALALPLADEEDDDEGAWLSAPVPLEADDDIPPPAPFTDVAAHEPARPAVPSALPDSDALQVAMAEPDLPVDALPVVRLHTPSVEPDAEPDFQTELETFAAGRAPDGVTAPMPLVAPEAVDPGPAPAQAAAVLPEPVPRAEPEAAGAEAEPGFVRQARRRAFWRSPGVRVALVAAGLLLSLLLAGQWALHERDRLAARHPGLKPLLVQLCEPLGCEVGPARQIDAIVIDSTALVRRLGNFYSFDLVLKNTASIPLAVPALELSLTDTSDVVIARRVFLPEELPGAPGLLPAGESVSLSLRLSLAVGDALPMAGYRALVFYP